MAFDEALAALVRALVAEVGAVEKKMFGGLAFLVRGNMSVAIHRSELLVRIDPAETERALNEPGVRICDVTGRPMRGWLLVAPSALDKKASLSKWVSKSVRYAQTLPAK